MSNVSWRYWPRSKVFVLHLVRSKLARASGLMFVSAVVAGVLGYVFQLLMGRLLALEDYGLLVTLMAIFSVVSVPFGALTMVVTRQSSGYFATQRFGAAASMYWAVHARVFWVAAAVVVCCLPFSPALRDYFGLGSLVPVWIFLLMGCSMLFGPINAAFLQGQQNFSWLALNSIAGQALKIAFAIGLILLGFGLNGALAGLLIAQVVGWVLTFAPLKPIVVGAYDGKRAEPLLSFASAAPVLVANLAFAVMTQLDMVLVKHYFDSQQAGLYAAASVLGKAVMYLPGAVTMAMFPMVAENEARQRSSAHLFLNALMLTAVLSGTGAVFYFLYADWIMPLLYGDRYAGASGVLKYYGFAMLPMALVMVAEHFLIAKGRVIFAYIMMLSVPFVLLAAHEFHNSLTDIVYILAACGWGLLLLGFAAIGAQYYFSIQRGRVHR